MKLILYKMVLCGTISPYRSTFYIKKTYKIQALHIKCIKIEGYCQEKGEKNEKNPSENTFMDDSDSERFFVGDGGCYNRDELQKHPLNAGEYHDRNSPYFGRACGDGT